MIFAAGFTVWVITAKGVAVLVLPFLALAVRASYTNRRLVVRRAYAIIAAAVWGFVTLTLGWQVALLWAGRTLMFLLLVDHLLQSLAASTLRTPFLQYHLATVVHVIVRALRVVRERNADLEYSRNLRISRRNGWWTRQLSWWGENLALLRTTFREFTELATQYEDVMQARGGLPHPKRWQDPTRFRSLLLYGDAVFVAMAGVVAVASLSHVYPAFLVTFGENVADLSARISTSIASAVGDAVVQ